MTLILSQFRMPETPYEMFGGVFSVLMILAASAGLIMGLAKMFAKKSAAQMEVANQPLQIRVTDEVPSRTEFNDLKNRVGHIEHSLAPMERRILEGVKEVGKDLTEKIAHLGEHEYKARGELWEKLNATAERTAGLEARKDVGDVIAEAIAKAAK